MMFTFNKSTLSVTVTHACSSENGFMSAEEFQEMAIEAIRERMHELFEANTNAFKVELTSSEPVAESEIKSLAHFAETFSFELEANEEGGND